MCAFNPPPTTYPPWYSRRTSSHIRRKRVHEFATDRWLDATTAARKTFWKSVMDWCVSDVHTYHFDPQKAVKYGQVFRLGGHG
jgi:hypothetical protein